MTLKNPYSALFSTLVLTSISACSSLPTSPLMNAPSNLAAPAAETFAFDYAAEGVQIYTCKASTKDASKFEWSFVAPEAKLFARDGNQVGKHYAGPSWEANDGSKVVGEVVARAESTDSNAIPLLLLRSKSNSGNGVFTGIKSIQRVGTKEGKAPASGCDANNVNKEIRVAYTARYNFFR